MSNQNKYIVAVAVLLVLVGGFFAFQKFGTQQQVACTQEAKACSDGTYVGRIGAKCEFAACPKENLIKVTSPTAFERTTSPLVIKGEARGNWFFEASFPVKLYDANNKLIAESFAPALGEWMTEDFVPFETNLTFKVTTEQKGTLVLEKDNPSGLPENADEIRIPLTLAP